VGSCSIRPPTPTTATSTWSGRTTASTVTYYDFRNDDLTGELTDHWIILCDPTKGNKSECSKASNWKGESRLTDTSFDIRDAPVAGALFLGDYAGQAAADTDLLPVFGIADGPGQSSIFVRRVTH
jgi:hypothetical protein